MKISTGIARLTRDPEIKYVSNNLAVVNFGIAKNKKYKNKDETIFLDVSIFGKQAETIHSNFRKGNRIILEGKLKMDTWDQNGSMRTKHSLLATEFEFVDYKDSDMIEMA